MRSLHIEHGFPNPLLNCLCLQRVVHGIKGRQGSASSVRLLLTDSIMLVIFNSLDLSLPEHRMFWAACTLAYFGFLCASEFTVPSSHSLSPSCHLTLQDVALDSLSSPDTLRVHIKVSKTYPFQRGTFIHSGRPLSLIHYSSLGFLSCLTWGWPWSPFSASVGPALVLSTFQTMA